MHILVSLLSSSPFFTQFPPSRLLSTSSSSLFAHPCIALSIPLPYHFNLIFPTLHYTDLDYTILSYLTLSSDTDISTHYTTLHFAFSLMYCKRVLPEPETARYSARHVIYYCHRILNFYKVYNVCIFFKI